MTAHDALRERLKGQLNSPIHSDLIINFGTKKWAVHRLVLSLQSRWFENALAGSFSESTEPVLELHEEDIRQDAVNSMVHWFYNLDYDQSEDYSVIAHHVMVYVLADKYEITELGMLAMEKLVRAVLRPQEDVAGFAYAIDFAYSNTTCSNHIIRAVFLQAAAMHKRQLLKDGRFTKMLDKNGEFAREMMQWDCGLPIGHDGEIIRTTAIIQNSELPCIGCGNPLKLPNIHCDNCGTSTCPYCGDRLRDSIIDYRQGKSELRCSCCGYIDD